MQNLGLESFKISLSGLPAGFAACLCGSEVYTCSCLLLLPAWNTCLSYKLQHVPPDGVPIPATLIANARFGLKPVACTIKLMCTCNEYCQLPTACSVLHAWSACHVIAIPATHIYCSAFCACCLLLVLPCCLCCLAVCAECYMHAVCIPYDTDWRLCSRCAAVLYLLSAIPRQSFDSCLCPSFMQLACTLVVQCTLL